MDNAKQPLGIEVQNIECSQICFSGASMSQVVDRFVFDKIQSLIPVIIRTHIRVIYRWRFITNFNLISNP